MAKAVLHIGTHKTATTTIQETFAQNRALLEREGLVYPRIDKFAGHHGLTKDWNLLPANYRLSGGSIANLRQIAKEHSKGDHTVLLSSEEFSRGDPKARVDFAAVREALAGFDSVEVVCVLREQWQFIQSIYLEVSKLATPERPPVILEQVFKQDLCQGLWTDYNQLYDFLLQNFEPEKIFFFDFDAMRKAEGGVLGQMLQYLGLPLDPERLDLVNEGRSNASPLALPAWAANLISQPKAPKSSLIEATTEAFKAQFGEKARGCLWTRAEFRHLLDYARKHNLRLAERLAPRQPGFAIHESKTTANEVFREDIDSQYWLRCSRWLYEQRR